MLLRRATGQKRDVTRVNGEKETKKAKELLAKGNENGGHKLILTSSFMSDYGKDFIAEAELDNELLDLLEERLEKKRQLLCSGPGEIFLVFQKRQHRRLPCSFKHSVTISFMQTLEMAVAMLDLQAFYQGFGGC